MWSRQVLGWWFSLNGAIHFHQRDANSFLLYTFMCYNGFRANSGNGVKPVRLFALNDFLFDIHMRMSNIFYEQCMNNMDIHFSLLIWAQAMYHMNHYDVLIDNGIGLDSASVYFWFCLGQSFVPNLIKRSHYLNGAIKVFSAIEEYQQPTFQ